MPTPQLGISPFDFKDTCAVTASNSVNFVDDTTNNPKAYPFISVLQVVVAGNISLETVRGITVTITSAPVGFEFKGPVKRVNSTGTTASVVAQIR